MTTDKTADRAERTEAAMHSTAQQLEETEATLHASAEAAADETTRQRLHALGDRVTACAKAIDERASKLTTEDDPGAV